MVAYKELVVGATGYTGGPTGPAISHPFDLGTGGYHSYRVLTGGLGADVMVSYDGVNDALRIPAGASGAVINPLILQNAYNKVWLRSAAGVTASFGIGLYTKQ